MSGAGDVAVIVPAAGSGRRMGGVHKQFLEVGGEPLLAVTLRPFLDHPRVRWIVVAVPAAELAAPPGWFAGFDGRVTFVAGGPERGSSVLAALAHVPAEAEVVVVHDAARPLVTRALIDRTLDAVAAGQGAVAAIPVGDTIKQVGSGRRIVKTPDRSDLWRAQTPQAFPRALLADAYHSAELMGHLDATDDAALVERHGGHVVVVDGDPDNIKVTTPGDIVIAEALLAARRARSAVPDDA